MANLKETAQWEEGIYQWETTDPVLGGENGIDNKPTRQLANRTVWLKQELEAAQQSQRKRLITVGAGLTGGGNLSADRSIALTTPSTLSGSTANWAGNGTVGHTHELAAATATLAGVVKLINALNSTATDAALSAAMGKALNDSKLDNSGSQTLNGTLTIQAAHNEYVGAAINNTTPNARGSFLALQVAGVMRGGVEIYGNGNGSYRVGLTATGNGDASDRHIQVLNAGVDNVWTKAYGYLHEYFASNIGLASSLNQLGNTLRSEINSKFTHSNYPSHYSGAEVWRFPQGLKITVMRLDNVGHEGNFILPEAYSGRAIAVASDVGDGLKTVSVFAIGNGSNALKIWTTGSPVSVNVVVIGFSA